MSIDYARRKARGGRGLIPPNNTQWDNEHHALDVRESLQLGENEPLPEIREVYKKIPREVTILPHGELPTAAVYTQYFRNAGRRSWSGLALPMPDGSIWVVYNDAHAPSRVRATLMEEFFHVYLGHPTTALRLLPNPEPPSRTYDAGIEYQAYGCAAAALVPYAGLKRMVGTGATVPQIAGAFVVSRDLVLFRLKVTKLYRAAVRWRRK